MVGLRITSKYRIVFVSALRFVSSPRSLVAFINKSYFFVFPLFHTLAVVLHFVYLALLIIFSSYCLRRLMTSLEQCDTVKIVFFITFLWPICFVSLCVLNQFVFVSPSQWNQWSTKTLLGWFSLVWCFPTTLSDDTYVEYICVACDF